MKNLQQKVAINHNIKATCPKTSAYKRLQHLMAFDIAQYRSYIDFKNIVKLCIDFKKSNTTVIKALTQKDLFRYSQGFSIQD